jgi:hypothetical protein
LVLLTNPMMAVQAETASSAESSTVDYAHKPSKAGWGYSRTYATNYERIFGKGKAEVEAEAVENPADRETEVTERADKQ